MPDVDEGIFRAAVRRVFDDRIMFPEMITKAEIVSLVREYARIFQEGINDTIRDGEIPEEMRRALDEDVFVFSGFRTYHALKEVATLLRDKKGQLRGFNEFYNDIASIREDYNKNWLHAEYIFATQSAGMAAKWQEIEEDGDDYDLQYRDANDDEVRPEHHAMNGITLPSSDLYWTYYFPPNGWRCRCTAVQVRRGKYERTDSRIAIEVGERATTEINSKGQNRAEMFRFNPGKEKVVFPPHHPYFYKSCADCRRRGTPPAGWKARELCRMCQGLKDVE